MEGKSMSKVDKRRGHEKQGDNEDNEEKRNSKRRKIKAVFDNEWDQVRDFWKTSRRFLTKKVEKRVSDTTIERLENEGNVILRPTELELVTGSVVILDKNQIPLVYFLKGALGWPFEKKDPCLVGVKALDSLVEHYGPPLQGNTDVRHRNKIHQSGDGVYHFALWHRQGHEKNKKTLERRTKGAIISSDDFCTCDKVNASIEFLQDFTPVTQAVGAIFEVIDKNGYDECKERFESLAKNAALSKMYMTSRNCFLDIAVLVGLCCSLHTDRKDSEYSWEADLAFGNFAGGYLEVPQIGLKFNLREGNVLFMRSTLLQHFVSPVEGNRFGVEYFSHKSVDE